jgi:hypothetical protein
MIIAIALQKAPVSQASHRDLINVYSLRSITLRNAT